VSSLVQGYEIVSQVMKNAAPVRTYAMLIFSVSFQIDQMPEGEINKPYLINILYFSPSHHQDHAFLNNSEISCAVLCYSGELFPPTRSHP